MISAGLVFLALALFAFRYHAPFGPPAESADATYLPRPGPQFLWLFELLKLLPGSIASVVGAAFPGLVLLALVSLPFVGGRITGKSFRNLIPVLYLLVLVFVAGLTAAAYIQDARDPQVRDQLARQAEEEKNFLAEPFQPKRLLSSEEVEKALAKPSPSPTSTGQTLPAKGDPPQSYIANCAQCHGFRGEGTALFPKLLGVSSKPRRTMDDLIKLLDDPVAYGLRPPMKSFAGKLTEQEKQEIAAWVETLPAKKK
jgi:cytochrome c553